MKPGVVVVVVFLPFIIPPKQKLFLVVLGLLVALWQ
jgi:hypothetical protein